MATASMFCEDESEPRERDRVRVFSYKLQSQFRKVTVRASGTAFLEELVRTVLGDVPQVSANLRELSLTQDVRLEAMELELVFLAMREGPRLNDLFLGDEYRLRKRLNVQTDANCPTQERIVLCGTVVLNRRAM